MKITIIMTDTEKKLCEKMKKKMEPILIDRKMIVNNEVRTKRIDDGNTIIIDVEEKVLSFIHKCVDKISYAASILMPMLKGIISDIHTEYQELDIENRRETYHSAREELEIKIANLNDEIVRDVADGADMEFIKCKIDALNLIKKDLELLDKCAKDLGIIQK